MACICFLVCIRIDNRRLGRGFTVLSGRVERGFTHATSSRRCLDGGSIQVGFILPWLRIQRLRGSLRFRLHLRQNHIVVAIIVVVVVIVVVILLKPMVARVRIVLGKRVEVLWQTRVLGLLLPRILGVCGRCGSSRFGGRTFGCRTSIWPALNLVVRGRKNLTQRLNPPQQSI